MPCSNPVSRYPRWGYLDKFEVNPYLMRAVLITVCVYLGVLAAFVGWRLAPRSAMEPITIGPRPIPIDFLQLEIISTTPRARLGPRVILQKRSFTMPVPVPNELVEPGPIEPDVTGLGTGETPDVRGTEAFDVGEGTLWVAPDPGVFIVVEVEPVLVTMAPPEYPELAREAGVSGDVLVRVLVGADGRVMQAFVLVSVPMLDEAALAAARTAVFKPALQSGRPVAVWVNVPISFQLHD